MTQTLNQAVTIRYVQFEEFNYNVTVCQSMQVGHKPRCCLERFVERTAARHLAHRKVLRQWINSDYYSGETGRNK